MDKRVKWLIENAYDFSSADDYLYSAMVKYEELESRVNKLLQTMPETSRNTICDYIEQRNELEFHLIRLALKY